MRNKETSKQTKNQTTELEKEGIKEPVTQGNVIKDKITLMHQAQCL